MGAAVGRHDGTTARRHDGTTARRHDGCYPAKGPAILPPLPPYRTTMSNAGVAPGTSKL
jgi:hypothetical protein